MIVISGCLITHKNAGVVRLALYESQMGGLNDRYFMYDGALGHFHAAVGSVRGCTWVGLVIRILCMIVHMGV